MIVAVLCTLAMLLTFPFASAHAEKIPALVDIPSNLPLEVKEKLSRQKQALEQELSDFQKAAVVFNGKDAKDQTDAEYEKLDSRRTSYIAEARAFNQSVYHERLAHFIGYTAPKGEFSIKYSDGRVLTNANAKGNIVIPVELGARVTTGPTGRVQMLLPDETVFTIGPNSDMVVDEFVYDPDNNPKKIAVSVTKGLFRLLTGKVAHKDPANMKVKLPVGTLGIRGTDLETNVESDGSGYIKLYSGELEITPLDGSPMIVLQGKNMVTFKADGTLGKPEPINHE